MKLVLVSFVVISVVGVGAVSGPKQNPERTRQVDVVDLMKEKVAVLQKLEKVHEEQLELVKGLYENHRVSTATIALSKSAVLDARVRRLEAELDLPGIARDRRIAVLRKKLGALQEMEKALETGVRVARRLYERNASASDDLAKARAAAINAEVRRIDCQIDLAQLGVATRKKGGKK